MLKKRCLRRSTVLWTIFPQFFRGYFSVQCIVWRAIFLDKKDKHFSLIENYVNLYVFKGNLYTIHTILFKTAQKWCVKRVRMGIDWWLIIGQNCTCRNEALLNRDLQNSLLAKRSPRNWESRGPFLEAPAPALITGPVKLFSCFPFQIGVSKLLKIIQ